MKNQLPYQLKHIPVNHLLHILFKLNEELNYFRRTKKKHPKKILNEKK